MNPNYEIIEDRRIEDLNSKGTILRHKKTGARVVLLSNDDENKVFCISFRTPPSDSTGVPHILEHSVLCGSKKFPAKDPFIELAKGSLNTFLNAMTAPDKTMYPIASCNDKDFQNLMEVYLDAVFYPNIYTRPQIFKQEGWRYELEDKNDPITINGVVYNEMKGAFSTPDDVLEREIINSLFPDTAYSCESGGDPDVIPELTYEQFLDFHSKYYHPSNSYIYLYGNMDMDEKLAYIHDEYLSKFDYLEVDSALKLQEPFKTPGTVTKSYAITNEEPLEDNTYISLNSRIETALDRELYVAFTVLDYALVAAPGAVVTERLLKSGLVQDVDSAYQNGTLMPYFSFIAKGANEKDKDEIVNIIQDELRNVVKNGLDKDTLLAGINVFEFKYREADFGRFPKGLMYGLQALDSWLYDDNAPFMHIEANSTYAFLREKVNTGYFEELIDKYLLNNPHSTIVMLTPERGLTAKKEKELAEKLEKLKSSMSEKEIEDLVVSTKELKAYQEEASTEEELNTIPLLSIEDIKKEARKINYKEDSVDGVTIINNEIFTNGIGYVNLSFDIKDLAKSDLPYIGLLANFFGYVNTKDHTYAALSSDVNINTGGISVSASLASDKDDASIYRLFVQAKIKALYDKLPVAFDLTKEILKTSDFSDDEHTKELLQMIKARMQPSFISDGHSTALKRAMSYIFESDACYELLSGLEFYRFIEDIIDNFDEKKSDLQAKLTDLLKVIFRKENLIASYTGEAKSYDCLKDCVKNFSCDLFTEEITANSTKLTLSKKNEGFKTGAKVQYVATAGNYKENGLPYTGALRVMKVIMGYDYLWNNVRVLGGAYGCMSGFSQSGKCYFVSYRDPNLTRTIEVYKGASDYLKNFNASERDMTKYIIGAISDMDTPLTPAQEGEAGFGSYLANRTNEDRQLERDQVIGCTIKDINNLSPYIDAMLKSQTLCVVGAEEVIKENAELFGEISELA